MVHKLGSGHNVLYEQGRYDEALTAFEEAIRLDPKDALPWNGKGNVLKEQDRYDEALKAYEEAIRLDPKDAAPLNGKGNVLYEQGRYDEALKAYEEAIRLAPKNKHPLNGKGCVLYKKGRYDEALESFEEAIQLDPKDTFPWNGKGNTLSEQTQYEEALTAYEEAIRLDPKSADPWNGKGNVLCKQGRYDEALKAYEEAIRLDPKGAFPFNGKGDVLNEQGRYDEALKAFEKSIRLDPKDASPLNGKGRALSEQNRYEEALTAYEEAIRLDPKSANPWNGKGGVLCKQDLYGEALKALEQAIRLNPKLASAWYNIGIILHTHGNLRKRNNARSPKQCFMRTVFIACPPRFATDIKILRGILLVMTEDGGMGLLMERIIRIILPESGLLTIKKMLSRIREETEVAHAVFAWLEDSDCPLQSIEKLRLRGQILLRFGDPIMARQGLDELDNTIEGERDLAGELYLVWSLREYLEPYEQELGFAYNKAKKWIQGEWGAADEMTYYYAGHIAFLKDDLRMAREAFKRAGQRPSSLLMAWQIARLMKDDQTADKYLNLLLAEEHKCLRAGQSGILFPKEPVPFDPNTTEGQDELQLVLRRFEVTGALMDLLETANLRKHPEYHALANDFEERTRVFNDIEQHEHAVRTWKVKEQVQQELERRQRATIREDAEKEMYAQAKDFAILDVAPPCSLSGDQLAERLAQNLFQRNLGGQRERVINVILSLFLQRRLKSEQAVLLTMFAYAKAHHDSHTIQIARIEKFAAQTAMEASILYLISRCGVGYVSSMFLGISGWSLSKKLVDAVQTIYGDFQVSEGESFPTYVDFVDHLHRYWDESGDAEEFRTFFE